MAKQEKVWTVLAMLEWATQHFEKRNVPDPRLSIEWLLADVLGIPRLDLYLKFDRPLAPDELDRLRPMVRRRSHHEPLQYITGYTDFYNCRIEVTRDVLIPRPETEQLVDLVLEDPQFDKTRPVTLLDIGTGSGCIPVAIGKERPAWICTGVDISPAALEVARRNATSNDVTVRWSRADLRSMEESTEWREQSFDLIVSNPPYILHEERPGLEREVAEFEPEGALFHEDPLKLYGAIGRYASQVLTPSGALYLECNDKLTGQIAEFMREIFTSVEILDDYSGKERFLRVSGRR